MKKQVLLWLALFYYFILQFFLIGYLWSINNFYILGIVNIVIYLFCTGLYIVFSSQINGLKYKLFLQKFWKGIDYFFHHYIFVLTLFLLLVLFIDKIFFSYINLNIWWFVGILIGLFIFGFHSLFQKNVYFGKKIFLPKDGLYVLSIFFGLLVFWIIGVNTTILSFSLFVSILFSFLFFVITIWIFRAIGVFSIWKLASSRLYLVLLIMSFVLIFPQSYFSVKNNNLIGDGDKPIFKLMINGIGDNFDKIKNKFLGNEKDNEEEIIEEDKGYSFSGLLESDNIDLYKTSGVVLEFSGEAITGNIDTGKNITGEMNLDETGLDLSTGLIQEVKEDFFPDLGDESLLTYADALKYLMDSNNIILSDKKVISFTYISKTNDLYPYFTTAFEYKLIGKSQKPSLNIKCDNYLVMKGILDGWDVSGYEGDIFQRYYNFAKENGKLNGCDLGKYLTKKNI